MNDSWPTDPRTKKLLEELSEAQALAEEYRLKIPTPGQEMLQRSLLQNYEAMEAKYTEMQKFLLRLPRVISPEDPQYGPIMANIQRLCSL